MASRKGIAVTAVILVGAVAASFLVYLLPEDTTMKISISDFEKHLDNTKERSSMVATSIDDSFKKLMNNQMNPDEYISIAEISSSQILSLEMELRSSDATQEWTESYVSYIGALKKLNEKITETVVVANLIDDNDIDPIDEILSKIKHLETESFDLEKKSDNSRP